MASGCREVLAAERPAARPLPELQAHEDARRGLGQGPLLFLDRPPVRAGALPGALTPEARQVQGTHGGVAARGALGTADRAAPGVGGRPTGRPALLPGVVLRPMSAADAAG